MEYQRTPKQMLRSFKIIERQAMDGRVGQDLAFAFYSLCHPKLSPAPAAGLRAGQGGAAERTAIHRSCL